MSTVIYLANRIVQIVKGNPGDRALVAECHEFEAPDGLLINGVIMDADAFVTFIKEIWSRCSFDKNGVTLVVNSSRFIGQIMELPQMSDYDTLGYITREYSEIDKGTDKVYGFMRLKGSESKLKRIYAESIDPSYINEYRNIFSLAGVNITGIYSGEGSLIGLLNNTISKNISNFILILAGCMTITSVLYLEGRNVYYNQVRCFHDKNTEDHIGEVARSISKIKQFMQANGFGEGLERILISGISEKSIDSYENAISEYGISTAVNMFTLDSYFSGKAAAVAGEFPFAVAGLIKSKGKNNYLKQAVEKKNNAFVLKNAKYFIPIIISAVVMLTLFIGSLIYEYARKRELDNLLNIITSDSDEINTYDVMIDENSSLGAKYLKLLEMSENLDSYPFVSEAMKEDIKNLYAVVEVEIGSFDAVTGRLEISVRTKENDKIALFADTLEKKDFINKVEYLGYSLSDDGYYLVEMTCILAESAGRVEVVYE